MSDSVDVDCPFCRVPADRVIGRNEYALALADAFPVAPGHSLVIPHRHVADFFELNEGEILAIWSLLSKVRRSLELRHQLAAYNVGVNVGSGAGKTVRHAHAHLIPRYSGDVADPAGGVRNVIPGKGRYP